jgi:hypothetical protein
VWELESGKKERSPEDLAAAIVQIAAINAGISMLDWVLGEALA